MELFAEDAKIEATVLRQGDILKGIPVPLMTTLESFLVLAETQSGDSDTPQIALKQYPHRNDSGWFMGHVRLRLSYCVMLTHCCELAPRHGKVTTPSVTVARLVLVKSKPSITDNPENLDKLKANSNPIQGKHYIQYFYVGSHGRLDGIQEWMVDFSQLISFPNSVCEELLQRKILQMDDRSRVKFKLRLGSYLSRITDEESEDGLRDPWDEENPPQTQTAS